MNADYIINIALREGIITKRPSKKGEKYLQHLINELNTENEEFILNYIDITKIY